MTRILKRRSRRQISAKAGDLILVGTPSISMPSDWYFARVLWVDRDSILVEHRGLGSEVFRSVIEPHRVRAVGDVKTLGEFRERCIAAVREVRRRVEQAERRLGDARKAVWVVLDRTAEIPGE